MQPRHSIRSETNKGKKKKFQQDYQSEEDTEVLRDFLIESQLKETQNKQRLYQIKRDNEVLKEQLSELEAQKKKLESAKDMNQKLFKKNESEILALKRPLDEQASFTESINSNNSHDSLRKKVKEVQKTNAQEIDAVLEKQPDFEKIMQSADGSLSKILGLLQSQLQIFKEELAQKESSYRHMQERYQNEFDILYDQHQAIRSKIEEISEEKKADMLKKYALERKISYLEADVELGDGYINAQKLAITAAKEINMKIQKADGTKSLNALNTKIQRRLELIKQI